MSYRGPALQYQIRKTTKGNKTGDNYAITIPRIIAKQFDATLFQMEVSGNCIIFTSGTKVTVSDIRIDNSKKVFVGGGTISFK